MRRFPIVAIGLLIFLVVTSCLFVVREGETALIIQLGKVKNQQGPGLHFKVPFLDDVKLFDSRILAWDGDPSEFR